MTPTIYTSFIKVAASGVKQAFTFICPNTEIIIDLIETIFDANFIKILTMTFFIIYRPIDLVFNPTRCDKNQKPILMVIDTPCMFYKDWVKIVTIRELTTRQS